MRAEVKRRILHVIDQTERGGAQSVIHAHIQALADRYAFGVAVLGAEGPLSSAYRALGVPVYELGRCTRRWSPLVLRALLEVIRREGYELIHTHLHKSNVIGVLAARLSGRPSILHDHAGMDPQSLAYYLPQRVLRAGYSRALRLALRCCSRVVVLTSSTRDAYRCVYPQQIEKVVVLPNMVNLARVDAARPSTSLREQLDLAANTRLVTMVGRLSREKDWLTFLRVAQYVGVGQVHPYVFLAVGGGPEEPALRAQRDVLGLEHVMLLGHRDDVPDLLRQSDVFLLTSEREQFPVVLLEAMAAGLPVVTTAFPGVDDIITPGVHGLSAPVRDAEGLARCVLQLLEDDGLCERMGAAGRARVEERFGIDVIRERLSQIYEELLAAAGVPA